MKRNKSIIVLLGCLDSSWPLSYILFSSIVTIFNVKNINLILVKFRDIFFFGHIAKTWFLPLDFTWALKSHLDLKHVFYGSIISRSSHTSQFLKGSVLQDGLICFLLFLCNLISSWVDQLDGNWDICYLPPLLFLAVLWLIMSLHNNASIKQYGVTIFIYLKEKSIHKLSFISLIS